MGLWRHSSFSPQDPGFKMMELYIETLTGTVFELRVSPYETVQDVKSRIQKLEGIPMSQQHLVWQAQELDDDYSLHDYAIQDGATLKLVLTMRGGPINTRRVPVEDAASLREMAEYFSAAAAADGGREEMAPSNRPVTVIVYQNGDQVNFFRVVDREMNSPTAESLSGASMYNLYDDDDAEDVEGLKEKLEDNDKTKGKMKLLRSKMENMIITKKPKNPSSTDSSISSTSKMPLPSSKSSSSGSKKSVPPTPQLIPHPPSSGRPHSMSRLSRRFPSTSSTSHGTNILNRNPCLPPVGHEQDSALRFAQLLKEKEEAKNTASSTTITSLADSGVGSSNASRLNESGKPSRLMGPLTSVKEDEPIENTPPSAVAPSSSDERVQQEVIEALLRQAHAVRSPRRWDYSSDVLLRDSCTSGKASGRGQKDSSGADNNNFESSSQQRPPSTSATPHPRGVERLWSDSSDILASQAAPPSMFPPTATTPAPGPSASTTTVPSAKRQISLDSFAESLVKSSVTNKPSTATATAGSSSKRDRNGGGGGVSSGSAGGRGVILESLNLQEVRVMSGLLKSYVQRTSATKTRATPTERKEGRRTPDGRLLSGRGPVMSRLGSGGGGRVSPRLAPMKHKKKATKRCFLCGKKTGLATSYQCRCGENFCASHRYAESHSCTFDYKTEGRKILQQSNPVVTAPKLPKI